MKIAISGASGKTGYRIAEEAIAAGHEVRLLIRKGSILPQTISDCETKTIDLGNKQSLDASLKGMDGLIIATGARPSVDLTGPARIDAIGVANQVDSCIRVNTKRIILVSSLCTGRWIHPLNLFGLILIWKRIGEQSLEKSGLDWTVIRPGGLSEDEENLEKQGICYTGPDLQEEAYIPRRLVARCCIEAIKTQESIGRIIEVTSSRDLAQTTMKEAIAGFKLNESLPNK